ncbi:hypothetical protein HZH68_009117 [Vespula germanica]|uniref:Uncharacterized protein n=1 Tax=Vespula germanica TaxID=30212 RepID=A0A834N6V4_VESGE|nr:hypothetical protein HZH68_009117 [Vespula germanica]
MEGLDVQKVEEPLQTPFQSFTYEQELLPRGKTIITSGALTGEKEEEKQQQQEEEEEEVVEVEMEKEVVEEEELTPLTEERWTEYSAEVRNSFGEHFSISS